MMATETAMAGGLASTTASALYTVGYSESHLLYTAGYNAACSSVHHCIQQRIHERCFEMLLEIVDASRV